MTDDATEERKSLCADTPEEAVTMTHGEAVELIDLLSRVKNALHAHALGSPSFQLTPLRANVLRRDIERWMR